VTAGNLYEAFHLTVITYEQVQLGMRSFLDTS